MAAAITFYGGAGNNQINTLSGGSGIGFFGASSFGSSISIGSYNGRTFICDPTGSSAGPEVENCLYNTSSTVILGQSGSGINLLACPNYLATLNIRFTNNSPVQTQNVTLYCYDRVSTSNFASGVILQAAQIIHPTTTQITNGSGNSTWVNLCSGSNQLGMISGPGTSGYSVNGLLTSDTEHDWYLALSASPLTVGAKTQFGLSFSLEYL